MRSGQIYVVDPADTSGAHLVEIDATDFGTGDVANSRPGTCRSRCSSGSNTRWW